MRGSHPKISRENGNERWIDWNLIQSWRIIDARVADGFKQAAMWKTISCRGKYFTSKQGTMAVCGLATTQWVLMGLTRKSFALCVENGRFTKVSRSRGRAFLVYIPPLAMRWQLSKTLACYLSRNIYSWLFIYC